MKLIVNGDLVNYEIYGAKHTQTLLVLHGWGRNIEDWKPVAEIFGKDHKVVLVDLPGFGQSQKPKKSLDSSDYVKIIQEFIKKLELKNITLIGHSFGGKLALLLAAKKLVNKVILISPSGLKNNNLIIRIRVPINRTFKPVIKILPSFVKNIIYKLVYPSDYHDAGEMKTIFKKIVKEYVQEDAKKITIPTVFIWGNLDKEVPVSYTKRFKELIPHSVIRIVWGAGHHPHLEKQRQFVEILSEYVN